MTDRPEPAARDEELPRFSPRLYAWFMWYVRGYLRRHFHAVRLLTGADGSPALPVIAGEPVIIYTNHPGWWDPLLFLLVGGRLAPERMNYGPIDARALGKYRFLERIGFIGIDMGTWRGSARFLRTVRAAGRRTDVFFWITAHGEFTDPRVRPVALRPGVGHAVAAATRGVVVPLAVEYPFWTERFPEALVACGPAIRIADAPPRTAEEWTAVLAGALEATQDRLAAAAIARDPAVFTTLLAGRVGVGPVYDAGRRFSAWLRGRQFDPAHELSESRHTSSRDAGARP
jgi:1-acyl-sn-glycerol-3-phosphate acyltransferase